MNYTIVFTLIVWDTLDMDKLYHDVTVHCVSSAEARRAALAMTPPEGMELLGVRNDNVWVYEVL